MDTKIYKKKSSQFRLDSIYEDKNQSLEALSGAE